MYQPKLDLAQNIIQQFSTPTAVISKPMLEEKIKAMKSAFSKNTKIFYAIKANNNPHIVKVLKNAGLDGIEHSRDPGTRLDIDMYAEEN